MESNPICYVEIPSPNISAIKKFYAEVFNWKISDSTLTDQAYAMFNSAENGLIGGFDTSKNPSNDGIIL